MWETGWRDRVWSDLDREWDLIIVGGGITGAGILHEAVRAGFRALLVEAHDFAAGASSRSSKLVHGGFRYLKNAQVKLTYESVREREWLLKEARGLVNPLGFLLTSHRGDRQPGWLFGLGLTAYDLLAMKWAHRYYDASDLRELCPPLSNERLNGGYRYFDAQTDDARLVLRLLKEATQAGGVVLNYARVKNLLRLQSGKVAGVVVEDQAPEAAITGARPALEIKARVVINATGAWGDDLRRLVGGRDRLRRLRGSHLVLPAARLPITRAVSFIHPRDGRFVFALPWDGVTLVGTTDVDHTPALNSDPSIDTYEVEYLLEGLAFAFPEQELDFRDIQATFSGVRPVIGTGKANPSKESREHLIWVENGLITVAGGKLTTFRPMALSALRAAALQLQTRLPGSTGERVLESIPPESTLEAPINRNARLRLLGRFGPQAGELLAAARPEEISQVPGTPYLWAELRWAARREAAVHLDDLLLRRARIGLLLPHAGLEHCERIRAIVQPEMGWDDSRWASEVDRYLRIWKKAYSPAALE